MRHRIALARRTVLPQAPACATRHRSFIGRVHGAHRGERGQAPLSMVLQRLAQPLVQRTGALVNFALTVIARGSLKQALPIASAGLPPFARTFSPTLVRQQLVQNIVTQRMALPLLNERRNAVQTVQRPQQAPPADLVAHFATHSHVEHATTYPRLTISVVRSVASAAVASESPAVPHGQTSQAGPARAASRAVSALDASAARHQLPPQELSRVTDHVLAQLDRKVLSFRERHGQI